MSRRGDNIRKRADGRWEGRYRMVLENGEKRYQCHLDKDNIAVRILFTASKHFVYSLFFYI